MGKYSTPVIPLNTLHFWKAGIALEVNSTDRLGKIIDLKRRKHLKEENREEKREDTELGKKVDKVCIEHMRSNHFKWTDVPQLILAMMRNTTLEAKIPPMMEVQGINESAST